jgi:hypothetical protein
MSIYLLGCKLVLSYRQISEFKADLLVIPYTTIKMEYYPGNIINNATVNYKTKITNKGSEISEPGYIYLQKNAGVGDFIGLAFLKIDNDKEESLKKGVTNLLKYV